MTKLHTSFLFKPSEYVYQEWAYDFLHTGWTTRSISEIRAASAVSFSAQYLSIYSMVIIFSSTAPRKHDKLGTSGSPMGARLCVISYESKYFVLIHTYKIYITSHSQKTAAYSNQLLLCNSCLRQFRRRCSHMTYLNTLHSCIPTPMSSMKLEHYGYLYHS